MSSTIFRNASVVNDNGSTTDQMRQLHYWTVCYKKHQLNIRFVGSQTVQQLLLGAHSIVAVECGASYWSPFTLATVFLWSTIYWRTIFHLGAKKQLQFSFHCSLRPYNEIQLLSVPPRNEVPFLKALNLSITRMPAVGLRDNEEIRGRFMLGLHMLASQKSWSG